MFLRLLVISIAGLHFATKVLNSFSLLHSQLDFVRFACVCAIF